MPRYTHACTHTHVSIYVHTLLCYCCGVVPVHSDLSDSLQPHGLQPPGFPVHGILQTGILQWVAIFFSRRSFQPWVQTCIFCTAGGFYIAETPGNSSYINLRKVSSKYSNEIKSGIKKRPKNNFFQEANPEQSQVARHVSPYERSMSITERDTFFSLAKLAGFP